MSWHIHHELLTAYLDDAVGDAHAASVETHLLSCAACRGAVADRTDRRVHAGTWDDLLDRVNEPRATLTEQVLRAVGVPGDLARLTAGAPTLRRAWLLSGLLILAVALVVAWLSASPVGIVLFLNTAAVAPVVGVALTYGPRADPAGELAAVVPFPATRLVLLRTLVVLCSWLPASALLALGLPHLAGFTLLWFLPAIALCAVTVLLAGFVDPVRAAVAVSGAWLVVTAPAWRGSRDAGTGEWLEQSVAFRDSGQAVLAAVAAVAVVVVVATARRAHRRSR
jgi:anti-sigma factor RsiW